MMTTERQTVISKYSIGYLICFSLVLVSSFGLTLYCIWISLDNNYNRFLLIGVSVVLMSVSIGLGIYHGITKQIIVTPDIIKVTYLFSGQTVVIKYQDIIKIANFRSESGRFNSDGTRSEIVETETERIRFGEEFSNYNELKNAIYNNAIAARQGANDI